VVEAATEADPEDDTEATTEAETDVAEGAAVTVDVVDTSKASTTILLSDSMISPKAAMFSF
jgi:hypothetical protein